MLIRSLDRDIYAELWTVMGSLEKKMFTCTFSGEAKLAVEAVA